ncbi:MAG: hypothetical protein ABW157_15235 [Candidatus Thiodiazotropha sp. LLP2]
MGDIDFDVLDLDEVMADDCLPELKGLQKKSRKGQARQRYDSLMEEKRLKQQLEDDFGYW